MSSVQVLKPTPTPLMTASGLPPADQDTAGLLTPTTASADGARRWGGIDGDRRPALVTIPLSLDVLVRITMVILVIVSSANRRNYPVRYEPINTPYGPIYRPIPYPTRMPDVMIVILTWNVVCLTLTGIRLLLELSKKSDAPWARRKWSCRLKIGNNTFKCLCGAEGDDDDDDNDDDDDRSMDIVRGLWFVIELGMTIMFLVYAVRGGARYDFTRLTWPIFGLMIGNALAMPFTIAGAAVIHYPWFWRPRRSVRLP